MSGPDLPTATLESLAAVARDDIWVVGALDDTAKTLVEHWDGHRWRVIASPNPGRTANELRDVAAISPRDVWAVGLTDAKSSALVEHWDGKRWRVVATPAGSGSLWGVSGDASDDVWAVGTDDNGVLVLNWNGRRWRRMPSPSVPASVTTGTLTGFTFLEGVAALSRTDVWAVGSLPGTPDQALLAHWNGRWTIARAPELAGGLGSLSALSSSDIWGTTGPRGRDTILHWDGAHWRRYRHPQMEGTSSDIAALSPSNVWLVSPIMHWNGRTWSVVHRPPQDDTLVTIAAVSPSDIWAAGFYDAIEHYSCGTS